MARKYSVFKELVATAGGLYDRNYQLAPSWSARILRAGRGHLARFSEGTGTDAGEPQARCLRSNALLRPFIRNLRFNLDRHRLQILFAGGDHGVLDSLGHVSRFALINFDNDLIVNDVYDLGRSLAQFITQKPQSALQDVRAGALDRRVLAVALRHRHLLSIGRIVA